MEYDNIILKILIEKKSFYEKCDIIPNAILLSNEAYRLLLNSAYIINHQGKKRQTVFGLKIYETIDREVFFKVALM